MAEEKEFDTEWTGLPVCPHCGTVDQDWWDGLGPKDDGDDWQARCGQCQQTFSVTISISYAFSTDKIKEPATH